MSVSPCYASILFTYYTQYEISANASQPPSVKGVSFCPDQ